jgi:AsmA protein
MVHGIKRLGLSAAVLIAALVVMLMAMSWLLNRDQVRASVEAQIRAVTGLDLAIKGDATVSLFPVSSVVFHNVSLTGGGGNEPALKVDEMTASLRLLPLLLQRFEIAGISLSEPHIIVRRDADGISNWTPLLQRLAQKLKPGTDGAVSFSEIRIKGGELAYRDDAEQVVEAVSGIDVSLAWPSISRSFAATGQFDWRGERIDGSININDFIAALSGERSGLKARLASAPLKLAFDGAMTNRASLMIEGTLSADSPSLREALRWAGQEIPDAGGLGRFALKARANTIGTAVALTNVNVELDGNVAEGVLSFNNDGRQTVQGTLAAESLDLTPYVNTVKVLASGAHDWNRQAFDLHSLSGIDLDLRLSAARVQVRNTKIGRTALGANIRAGTLTLSVGEAQMYGGIVRGSFSLAHLDHADDAADVKAQFQLNDVDLESCISELFGFHRLSGRGNLNLTLEASGSSPFGLAQTVDGTASLTGHDGALSGFNVEQLLRRLERRPLSGAGEFRSGRTPFNTLNVAIRFNDGIATADDIRLQGPAVRLTLTGATSIPTREFDLKGVASLVPSAEAAPTFELPFVLQGPWDDPLLFPDSDSLIRRSPASAPLLDAVRDRRARDAVRSAIERLTGTKTPTATAAPAAEDKPAASVQQ